MKEIQDVVNAQVKLMSESGEIQKQVEDGVKSAIKKAIERQFESYGNVTKQLESAFKDNLLLDKSSLDIPSLNAVMTEVVNANINKFYRGQAAEKLHALMKEKLSPLPETMALHEFVSLLCKEMFVDEYDRYDEVDDFATVECEASNYGTYNLKVWKQKESTYGRSNSCDVHLSINKDGTLNGRHGSTSPYYLFDVDAMIFKAYSQGVIFTGVGGFDSDDCELSLKDPEY